MVKQRPKRKRGCSWASTTESSLDRRKFVRLACLNINGWSEQSRFDVLAAIEAKNVDVFSLVETKIRREDKEKIEVPGFEVFQSRRQEVTLDKKGGGIACLVRKSAGVNFKKLSHDIPRAELNYVDNERLWISYQSQHGKTAICTVYLGYNDSDDRHYDWNRGILEVLAEEVRGLRDEGFRVILQGDFNAHVGSSLLLGGIPGNHPTRPNKNGELFLSFLAENQLLHLNGAVRQHGVWESRLCQGMWTRHSKDYRSSTVLDYVVITAEHLGTAREMVVDQGGLHGGDSDHNMIFSRFDDKFISARPRNTSPKLSWNITEDTDFTVFKQVVERELEGLSGVGPGVDALSDGLTKVLTTALREGVGVRSSSKQSSKIYPRHVVNLLNERKSLERNLKSLKCAYASSHFQAPPDSILVAREKLESKSSEISRALAAFNRQRRGPLLNLAKSKTRRGRKRFWDFVSRKTRKSTDITSVQDKLTGALKCEPEEISAEVRSYLMRIFSGLDDVPQDDADTDGVEEEDLDLVEDDQEGVNVGDDLPRNPQHEHDYGIKDDARLPEFSTGSGHPGDDPAGFLEKDISVGEVLAVVHSLKAGKAAGHDDLGNEPLKNAPASFYQHLTVLYNRVKDQSQVPKAWNRGRVVLVHKKGDTTEMNNYRPLTVLTCMNATYSKILNSRLTEVVERHRLLGEIQNGFRKKRSGGDSSFILNTILWKSLAKRKKVHLAFMDLQKAYDSVDRGVLWKKLGDLGFGGKFLESIKSLYKGDFITCKTNGITTNPVYLRRGLRQGCSLSPILFALYVTDLSRDLAASNLGVELYRVCVSALFFADDFVLISKTSEGLRLLNDIVLRHCNDLRMKLSISKSKVMSSSHDVWELFDGDELIGCLEKVLQFKYLGVETSLSTFKAGRAMMKRATSLANSYRGACIRIAKDGPDIVDLAMSLWMNVAMPSLLYGCEAVSFTKQTVLDISRQQSSVGKFCLGLPSCSPNISSSVILGQKTFKELLYSAQLKFYVRLSNQPNDRWSKDALLDNLCGGWASPYIKMLGDIKQEVGMFRWPVSSRHVDIVLSHHFMEETNSAIRRLHLPALMPISKRQRMSHVNESSESQVVVEFSFHVSLLFDLF